MKMIRVTTVNDFKLFYTITREIYVDYKYHRSTDNEIVKLLVKGPTAFHSHADVIPFLMFQNERVIGRFAFIVDKKLTDYIQVSFFEAFHFAGDIIKIIVERARLEFPGCNKIVFGLNGHLNYGAGILLDRFDTTPVFGLPYNADYYQSFFPGFQKNTMVSYRFPFSPFINYYHSMKGKLAKQGITVRKMNKKRLREEIKIYTYLNNECFRDHPYWAERSMEEDFELFHPFRFLLNEENLLFAEKGGKAIGFFLWYPDFNQLVKNDQQIGVKQLLRYIFSNPIDTFRFTEIAVLPEFRLSNAVQEMIMAAIPFMKNRGFQYGEGGFIFEENRNSIAMTLRFLQRATGEKPLPYRRYAVFEKNLY